MHSPRPSSDSEVMGWPGLNTDIFPVYENGPEDGAIREAASQRRGMKKHSDSATVGGAGC